MKRYIYMLLPGLLVVCLAVAWAAPQGELRYVSVKSLPVKRAPFGLSTTVAPLPYGAMVTLVNDNVPPAQPSGNGKKVKNETSRPAAVYGPWVKVITGNIEGYVPAASLMTLDMFTAQSSGAPTTEADAKAGKGFSDSEEPDVIAAKGALGKMSSGSSDPAALDKLLQTQPQGDVTEQGRDFRRTGKLGEFKPAGGQS